MRMKITLGSPAIDFEFKVILLLDWLPNNPRDPSLPYRLRRDVFCNICQDPTMPHTHAFPKSTSAG